MARRAEELLDLLSDEEISRIHELLTTPNEDFPSPQTYLEEEFYETLKRAYSNKLFIDPGKVVQIKSFFQIIGLL